MDESTPLRALTIGVSVFMAIATITAVMVYYNTAKSAAGVAVSGSSDIAESYREDIEESLLYKSEITGTEVINIINYFRNDVNVQVNVSKIRFVQKANETGLTCTKSDDKYICTALEQTNINNTTDEKKLSLTLKRILPNQSFSISTSDPDENGVRVITIIGK